MPVPALIIIAQEFVPGAPATASGMVIELGSALAGIGYIVLGRVQEAVGLTNEIVIGFCMVVPSALIALVVLSELSRRDASGGVIVYRRKCPSRWAST